MSRLSLCGASLAALAALGALAQGASPGFFPPTPDGDVALTKIVPPKDPAAPPAAAQPRVQPSPAVVAVAPTVTALDRQEAVRDAEQDLDRAERDAERERQRALATPAPIQGAFTGATSERDR